MADWAIYILIFLIGFVLIRGLHLTNRTAKPTLTFCEDSAYVQRILKLCPSFEKPYVPPKLWGMSGHLQTLIYSWLGRIEPPMPHGERINIRMEDGATSTFDVFQRLQDHETGEDFTIIICPGIGNSSETCYVRTMVDFCQKSGFRVAVLNHLGALKDVKLTSPRIFTYGGTDELGAMVARMRALYPETRLIGCGLSMGANLILKYLGENKNHQTEFMGVISACQGYDILRGMPGLGAEPRNKSSFRNGQLTLTWDHLRRVYNYAMTRGQLNFIGRHQDVLFGAETAGKFDVEEIFASSCLQELDERYTRRRAGFPSIEDYYKWCSCVHHIHEIELPVFLLNAHDDPIVPTALFDIPTKFVAQNNKSIFVVTKHGGHLGFFEPRADNHFLAQPITWLDRVVIEYANALISVTADQSENLLQNETETETITTDDGLSVTSTFTSNIIVTS